MTDYFFFKNVMNVAVYSLFSFKFSEPTVSSVPQTPVSAAWAPQVGEAALGAATGSKAERGLAIPH